MEHFVIYDVRGRRVAQGKGSDLKDVRLPSGVFYVETSGALKTTRKMVVIK